jgi:hypothetical protein
MLENCGHLPVEQPGLTRLREAVLAFAEEVTASARSFSG